MRDKSISYHLSSLIFFERFYFINLENEKITKKWLNRKQTNLF